jgi:hypothetical protein
MLAPELQVQLQLDRIIALLESIDAALHPPAPPSTEVVVGEVANAQTAADLMRYRKAT